MEREQHARRPALRLALVYAVISGLYIVVSDQLVGLLSQTLQDETWLQTLKGLAFVFVTAGVLYWFARREFEKENRLSAILSEREERERTILETAQEGVWSVDEKGVTTYANRALGRMLGYEPEELIGRSAFDHIWEEDREETRKRFFQGELVSPTEHIELRVARRDGSLMWGLLSVSLDFSTEGHLNSATGFLVDITDRKAHEENLARSLKEKEVLIQEIHHRVKNNLQVISSFLNLQVHHLPEGQDPQHLRSSQNRVRSMALVHERLYQNADYHTIEMSGYLSDLVHAVRASVDTSEGRIGVRIECAPINLDIGRAVPVGLVVNELLSNSFEHAFAVGERGTIHVRMRERNDGWITLEIGDDGNGVNELADVAASDSLGIQIVRALVDQLHGRLTWNIDHGVGAVIEIAPSSQRSS